MLHAYDLIILEFIAGTGGTLVHSGAVHVTALGSTAVILLFILGQLEIGHRREALMLFVGASLTGAVTFVLKYAIDRPRPDIGSVFATYISTPSFPSGHTALAFTAAVILAHQYPHAQRFFYLLAALVGITRLVLGVHFPSDVVVGAVIGTGIGLLTIRYGDRLLAPLAAKLD